MATRPVGAQVALALGVLLLTFFMGLLAAVGLSAQTDTVAALFGGFLALAFYLANAHAFRPLLAVALPRRLLGIPNRKPFGTVAPGEFLWAVRRGLRPEIALYLAELSGGLGPATSWPARVRQQRPAKALHPGTLNRIMLWGLPLEAQLIELMYWALAPEANLTFLVIIMPLMATLVAATVILYDLRQVRRWVGWYRRLGASVAEEVLEPQPTFSAYAQAPDVGRSTRGP